MTWLCRLSLAAWVLVILLAIYVAWASGLFLDKHGRNPWEKRR